MNIVLTSFYYKPHFGGVENSLFHLAKEYQSLGDSVAIVCSDLALSKKNRLPEHDFLDGIEIVRFKGFIPRFTLFHILGPLTNIWACRKVALLLKKRFNPDLVITRHFITGIAFYFAGHRNLNYLIPGVVAYQDTLPLKMATSSPKQRLINLYNIALLVSQNAVLQKFFLTKASKLFVFSANMRTQVLRLLGKKEYPITVTKPGVSVDRFIEHDKSDARTAIGIAAESYVFLCLGRLTAHKGIDKAIRAFSQIPKDRNAVLAIVGAGPEKGALMSLAQSLSLGTRVAFYDHTEKPELYYGAADAFIMSSISETFGQTILEAMAANVPVIALEPDGKNIVTASNELILHNRTGLLVPDGGDYLADAMQLLVDNRELAAQLCENASKELTNYSWRKLAIELIS